MQAKYVVLNLSKLNTEGIINLGNTIAGKLTGNVQLPAPPVTPADLTKATEALASIYARAKFSRSKIDFTTVRTLKAELIGLIKQEAEYVEWIAKGDAEIILSAGMNVNKNRQKHPAPEQVTDIKGIFTGIPGTVGLTWNRPRYSQLFKVLMTETPDVALSWKVIDTITSRRLMVQNLAGGKRFYFKVVPVNAAGVGPDSEIAEAIAA